MFIDHVHVHAREDVMRSELACTITQAVIEICGHLPEIIDLDSVPGALITILVALQ